MPSCKNSAPSRPILTMNCKMAIIEMGREESEIAYSAHSASRLLVTMLRAQKYARSMIDVAMALPIERILIGKSAFTSTIAMSKVIIASYCSKNNVLFPKNIFLASDNVLIAMRIDTTRNEKSKIEIEGSTRSVEKNENSGDKRET